MGNLFTLLDKKTIFHLNIVSLIVTAICEAFAITMLLTKGQDANLENWKLKVMLFTVVIISILFILSLVSFVYFLRLKDEKKK
jgi:heme/copper-type cytochrome/quinol oxidase subunit 2